MRMGNGIHNSPVKMSIEHAYLGREMCHAANTCNTKIVVVNILVDIMLCDRYLVDFG